MSRLMNMAFTIVAACALLAFSCLLHADAYAYELHDPIYINGDGDFTPENGVVGGSGTPGDPYVIEGWEISTTGAIGIRIYNTTAHFIVRDCYVHGSGIYSFTGITLFRVENGRLENNIVSENSNGILLGMSSDNTLVNNVSSNNKHGIRLNRSPHNILTGNAMSGNIYSFDVTIYNIADYYQTIDPSNTVEGKPVYYWVDENGQQVPDDAGLVVLVNCETIIVSNLNLTNNYYGVLLAGTNDTRVENVNVANSHDGIYLWNSEGNTLIDNNAHSNHYNGIVLNNSPRNIVDHNTVSNKLHGIKLVHSDDNTLINNTIESNRSNGIYFEYSNGNEIANNTVTNNLYGIFLEKFSDGNLIYNNLFNNSYNWLAVGASLVNDWNTDPTPGTNIVGGPTIAGNYWSDYTGEDTDGDGLGDEDQNGPHPGRYGPGDNHPLVEILPPVIVDIDPEEQEGLPGERLFFTVSITNNDTAFHVFDLDWDGGGWDWDLYERSISLGAGECGEVTLDVTIWKGANPGEEDTVTVTATARDNPALTDNASCTARVASLVSVEIIPEEQEGDPGERLYYTVSVTNNDSAHHVYNLDCDGGGWDWDLYERYIALDDGESGDVTLDVTIWKAANPGDEDIVTVTATAQDDPSITDSASCTARVEVKGLTPHGPIHIDDNEDFTPENGVTGGSGTPEDPYIIEGWEISPGYPAAVTVENTTAYFVIRNCTALNGGSAKDGIHLYMVQNGRVEDVNASGNNNGIYLSSSYNIVDNCTVSDNFIGIYSIGLGSHHNTISNNTAINNYLGIGLQWSQHEILVNNMVRLNDAGIEVHAEKNYVLYNTVSENNGCGILAEDSHVSTYIGNIIDSNGYGIDASGADDNVYYNNTISNNEYGYRAAHSGSNVFIGNTIDSNAVYGFGLFESAGGNLIYNNCFNNTTNWLGDSSFYNEWNIDPTPGTLNIIGGPYLGGNYWNDYTGADNNGDGLGDEDQNGADPGLYGPGDHHPLVYTRSSAPKKPKSLRPLPSSTSPPTKSAPAI